MLLKLLKAKIRLVQIKINNQLMCQWHKWIKIGLTIILIEIIAITGWINYYFLSQTHTSVIPIARAAEVSQIVEPVKADSPEVINSYDSPESIKGLVTKYFGEDSNTMLQIMQWESSNNPNAINHNSNGTIDCGLFQINSVHGYDCEWLKNPENNIKAAKQVFDKQGFHAWVSYNHSSLNN